MNRPKISKSEKEKVIKDIKVGVKELDDIKKQKRQLEHHLTDLILTHGHNITLLDGVMSKLVRLNFASPPYLRKGIAQMEREEDSPF